MPSATFYSVAKVGRDSVVISFYKEKPGGWKLNFEDESGEYVSNGDRWVESLDDLVLQIGNFTDKDLVWREENSESDVSFYGAVKRCIID